MPKYKRSLGTIKITTPHQEFTAYMKAELNNFADWNPTLVTKLGNSYRTEHWEIILNHAGITVKSKEPVVYLRHGIRIMMGEARIIIA